MDIIDYPFFILFKETKKDAEKGEFKLNAINDMFLISTPSSVIGIINFNMNVNYVDISYKLREIYEHYKHAKKVHIYIDLKFYESGLYEYGGYSKQITNFLDIIFKQLNEFRSYSRKKVYVHWYHQVRQYEFDKYYNEDINKSSETYKIPIICNSNDVYTIGTSEDGCKHIIVQYFRKRMCDPFEIIINHRNTYIHKKQ